MSNVQLDSGSEWLIKCSVRHSMGKSWKEVSGQDCLTWLRVDANRNAYRLNQEAYYRREGKTFDPTTDRALSILNGTYSPRVKLPAKTEKPKAIKKIGRPKGSKNKPKGSAATLTALTQAVSALNQALSALDIKIK